MRYGRAIALAGLMAGLVGLAPVVPVPGGVQVVAQTADQQQAVLISATYNLVGEISRNPDILHFRK